MTNKKFEVGDIVHLNNGDGTLRKGTIQDVIKDVRKEDVFAYIVEYPETIIVSENELIKNEDKELRYPVFVDEKDNECRAYVIGLNVKSTRKTKEEVLEEIKYSITELIYYLLKNGEKVPAPAFTDTSNDSIEFVSIDI
jgi:hypothetical protein